MPILLFDGDVGHHKRQFRTLANKVLGISMAESTLEVKHLIPSATGPAGSIPHAAFCSRGCYANDKHGLSGTCTCKGCGGDAHGRGKKYAFDHGYLRHSPPGSRKEPLDQEWLFSEEYFTQN
jgi:hypothetical protein